MLGEITVPISREFAKLALLSILIIASVYIALQSTTLTEGQMAIWPADGIALAMMLGPFRHRQILVLLLVEISACVPGVLMGDSIVLVTSLRVASILILLPISLYLTRYEYANEAHKSKNIVRLFAISLLGCAVLAVFQTAIVSFFFKITFIPVYLSVAAANWVAYAVLTPVLLIMTMPRKPPAQGAARSSRPAWVLLGYAGVLVLVFGQSLYPMLFLLPLALMAVAYTTSIAVVASCLLVTALIAIYATLHGHGPMMMMPGTPMDRLFMLQVVLGIITATGLPIAALMAEHAGLKQSLVTARLDAEAVSDAKSNFLATFSHEIRTPLNGVLGMAQIMGMGELNIDQAERLKVIRHSGETLLSILNDVLDLSKIEAGKIALEEIDFDLLQTLEATVRSFAPLAREKGLDFAWDLDAAGVYRGDPTRLRQILSNLLSNALKFTSSGAIRVTARYSAESLSVSVIDTGIGIAPETLGRLFSKFTQADQTTTRRFGGTGLGLSICRELATLMGGEIEVQSEEGRGSTFTASLPLVRLGDITTGEDHDAPRSGALGQGLRVLAAEDNPTNQLVLRTLLELAGAEITIVDNGAEAVRVWGEGDWDVILMDVRMPIMDGPAAAREIRALEMSQGRGRTPIIALTADTMSHQVSLHLDAGMDMHVAKPIDAADLFQAIERAVQPMPSSAYEDGLKEHRPRATRL